MIAKNSSKTEFKSLLEKRKSQIKPNLHLKELGERANKT